MSKEKFWARVNIKGEDDCWEWIGPKGEFGYGRFYLGGYKTDNSHRVAYLYHFGSIPEGKSILHKCDNPGCCNPKHLYAGTQSDNNRDNVARKRTVYHETLVTACPRGHEYTEENTYRFPDGRRQCRICRKEYVKKHSRKEALRRWAEGG